MKPLKRAVLLILSLSLLLGLSSCGSLGASGPEMPMEFTIDGHQLVLGQTTTGEISGWGWEVSLTGSQNEIRSDAKYVACYFSVNKGEGSGSQFWVSVYVPFQKNMVGDRVSLASEEKEAATQGVVYRVEVRKDASENYDIEYNGMNYQDLTWDDAAGWGAAEKEGAYPTTYEMDAAQGSLKLEKGYTGKDEPGKFTLTMNTAAFTKLQK